MIDITKAQAGQTTRNGTDGEWIITLKDEELYRLPAHFTVQETFMIRGIVEKMMKHAADEMKEQEQQLCLVKINRLKEHDERYLNELKQENIRITKILEQHIEVA